MCHATSASQKAGSVSTNKSQFVDTLSMNKAYLYINAYQIKKRFRVTCGISKLALCDTQTKAISQSASYCPTRQIPALIQSCSLILFILPKLPWYGVARPSNGPGHVQVQYGEQEDGQQEEEQEGELMDWVALGRRVGSRRLSRWWRKRWSKSWNES